MSADGRTVYVGCNDGRLYAVDVESGAMRWAYRAGGYIAGSPAIGADGTIYVGAGDARMHAVRPDGSERWTFQVGDWIDSSPAIGADGTIYFGSYDRHVYAVAPDGSEKWRYPVGGHVLSSPAIGSDGTVYVGANDQRLHAIWPDGTKRWDYFANGEIQSSPAIGADGTIYFAADISLYALTPAGKERWKTRIASTSWSSAAVRADGTIILGADDGVVRALNPDDGTVRWRFDTKTGPGNLIESSPIVAEDGSIYVGSFDGFLYKLNGNGSPLSAVSAWPAFGRDGVRRARAETVGGAGRLLNLSTRAHVEGDATLIAGFAVQGPAKEARAFLLRGIGPALGQFQLSGMPNPRLDVFSGSEPMAANDDWEVNLSRWSVSDTSAGLGAFPLPSGSKDAALVLALIPGLYTNHVSSVDRQGGVALVEVYDAIGGDDSVRLVNLSTRGKAGEGESTLVAGVAVGGAKSRLLLRAVGPGLTQFGVPNVIARPLLTLYGRTASGESQVLRTNDGWSVATRAYDLAAAARVSGAFPLEPGSTDCAMVVTVDPGLYTLQVTGRESATGEALVEIYLLP